MKAERPPPARDRRPARRSPRRSPGAEPRGGRRHPQGGARGRPRRDRAPARRAALCRHRGRRGLCLPDRPDPPPRLRFRHPPAPSARQRHHLGAAADDGGRRLWPRRDGAPFGRRHRLRHAVEADRLDRKRDRGDPLSALGPRPQGRPQHAQRRRGDPRRAAPTIRSAPPSRIALRLGRRGALRRGRGALLEGGRRRLGRRLRQGEARRARGAAPTDGRQPLRRRAQRQGGQRRPSRPPRSVLDRQICLSPARGRRAGRGRPALGRGAAPVPPRRALPVGGALPPPPDRRPRRGTAHLRLSARDRGADELCRPARHIARSSASCATISCTRRWSAT